MKSLTTGRATSASSSAIRTSRRAALTSASFSAPRFFRPSKTLPSRDVRPSNMGLPVSPTLRSDEAQTKTAPVRETRGLTGPSGRRGLPIFRCGGFYCPHRAKSSAMRGGAACFSGLIPVDAAGGWPYNARHGAMAIGDDSIHEDARAGQRFRCHRRAGRGGFDRPGGRARHRRPQAGGGLRPADRDRAAPERRRMPSCGSATPTAARSMPAATPRAAWPTC